MTQLNWRLSNCMAGDVHLLLVVHDQPALGDSPRRVDCLFNKFLPFYRWRLRRALRHLRAEWVKTYISGLILNDPYEVVR